MTKSASGKGKEEPKEMEVMATKHGTTIFKQDFKNKVHADFYRLFEHLWGSSIGFGTYLGDSDDKTDEQYKNAIQKAISLGCNFIDTAINYRCQRSERVIGKVLKSLHKTDPEIREKIIISTKGGFLPYDNQAPSDPVRYIMKKFVDPGIIIPEDIIAGCHCMTPSYIDHQLEESLKNLQLECIDIYYIHNPETQLEKVPRNLFYEQLFRVFKHLENKVDQGKIQFYGVATWDGLRMYPDDKHYLPLRGLVEFAKMAGGDNHHFRFVQVPFNLKMSEAFTVKNQIVEKKQMSLLEAASCLDLSVVTSAPIMQNRLAKGLPAEVSKFVKGLSTDSQRAIQFARSAPAVVSSLVGMKDLTHVEENLQLAAFSPMNHNEFMQMFE